MTHKPRNHNLNVYALKNFKMHEAKTARPERRKRKTHNFTEAIST